MKRNNEHNRDLSLLISLVAVAVLAFGAIKVAETIQQVFNVGITVYRDYGDGTQYQDYFDYGLPFVAVEDPDGANAYRGEGTGVNIYPEEGGYYVYAQFGRWWKPDTNAIGCAGYIGGACVHLSEVGDYFDIVPWYRGLSLSATSNSIQIVDCESDGSCHSTTIIYWGDGKIWLGPME